MSGAYIIPINGLKEGRHNYNFEIDKGFFEQFEGSEIEEGKLNAEVNAEKSSSHLDLSIKITGTVRVTCDRCLEMFDYTVNSSNRLLVKFGKQADNSDPDIITVQEDESEIDLNQYFYEYIVLALPIQKVHPDDIEGHSTCNPEMLGKLKEYVSGEEDGSDPRWDELKKLMSNN